METLHHQQKARYAITQDINKPFQMLRVITRVVQHNVAANNETSIIEGKCLFLEEVNLYLTIKLSGMDVVIYTQDLNQVPSILMARLGQWMTLDRCGLEGLVYIRIELETYNYDYDSEVASVTMH